MSDHPPRLWRSRWAAIGAAVAVTLGAGGLATTFAASSPSSLVAISPVRVLDTRIAAMGPALSSGAPRLLDVTGTVPTVGADGITVANATVVPDGATALVANVTIVTPTTPGFVAVRPGTATGNPTTSSLNATAADVIVPNSVTVEVPTTGPTAGQIQLWFQGSAPGATTHLLVDIVGYYQAAAAGPRGLSAWDTIPSGQTITGELVYDESAASPASDYVQVVFPARAPANVTSANVNFKADGDTRTVDDDASCTGTAANPTAPPGKVCIYPSSSLGFMVSVSGEELFTLKTTGFYIRYIPNGADVDVYIYATWAYTAP